MLHIYIDGDGCPVKEETYRVADRYGLPITVVANKAMTIPTNERTRMIVVRSGHLDAADDWIAENAGPHDIVITADIPLAHRSLQKGARVLGPKGEEFTPESIGDAMATRELMQSLREMGASRGGPPPMDKKDRSRFLGKLDQVIQNIKRTHGPIPLG
ncbi:MAG: YaiI/YqxD family protein [Proteobacteria bacterium]|nr:MAG: YaiI/YqxD family protein [Pseudomonadota bacterium]